jgi:outer membrane protein OmpA-like peptidoglycan-associated protein
MPHSLTARLPRVLVLAAVAALAAAAPHTADAQSWGDRLKKKAEEAAKRAAETRVERRTGDAVNGALDAVEGSVKGAAGTAAGGSAAGAPTSATPASTAAAAAAATAAAPAAAPGAARAERPGEGAWANYDFKPGDRVLFADDFTRDEVGNFPRRLEFVSGSVELVEWQGKRWLSAGNTGELHVPLPETLPERFTVEFDLAGSGNAMVVTFDGKSTIHRREAGTDRLEFGTWFAGLKGNRDASGPTGYKTEEAPVKVRIAVDGDYAKVYVNEKRVSNVPNAKLGRSNKIYVALNGWSDKAPRMIGDVRVAAGGKRLYDAIAETGRVATQGIYFDTGKDVLRAESTPTLKEIAAMMAEHPELKLAIEGHTDNAGDAAANVALSERRAAAVRATLVGSFGVDAARLTSKGLGAGKPAASNATAEGRQQNRRVELVKL